MTDWNSAFLNAIRSKTGPASSDGCQTWMGTVRSDRGSCKSVVQIDKEHRSVNVHRFLWNIEHPNDLLDKKHTCQPNCGNILCVNVAHLQKSPKKQDFDAASAWVRLQGHGSRRTDGCLVANKPFKRVFFGSSIMGIHRAAHMLHHNLQDPPPERNEGGIKMVIRHICNESHCFEPTHLAYGTQVDNCFDDKIANGTLRQGVQAHMATITENLAREIHVSKPTSRYAQAGHETQRQRADRFGVHVQSGKAWTHVK
jgi:hypothetical protein